MTVFKPAKKLSEYLLKKVILEQASSNFVKLGQFIGLHQYHLLENQDGKFLYEYGVGVNNYDFTLTENDAFEKLSDVISELKKAKFHLLWLPISRGLDHCTADIHGNVIIRTIEFYEAAIDEILKRYDVMVEAVA